MLRPVALALLGALLVLTAMPAQAGPLAGSACDAAPAGPDPAERLSRVIVADLDGDGRSDDACRFVWDSAADLGKAAHEACHVVQVRPGVGEGAREPVTACVVAGDLDGDGMLDRAAWACSAAGEASGACAGAAAAAKGKHDAAMAAIQNTR